MANEKKNKENALENKCPSCTASISFNPKIGKFKCEYCGNEFSIEELQQYNNNASTKKNNEEQVEIVDDYDNYVSYTCQSCGAEIIADEQTASTFCVYCGNTAILKNKLSGKFSPHKIILFKHEREDAVNAFKGLSKGRPLMPKDFNSEKNIEKIKGVYIPFWLYDVKIQGNINMLGELVTRWSSGDTRYVKTDKYKIIRGGELYYDCIPVDGSSRFADDIMNSIEPFNYSELIPYNHAYLSGFYAEKYDVEGDIPRKIAEDRAMNSALENLKNDARRYTAQVVTENNLAANTQKTEYAMLPVWMVNVKYNNKMHVFAMNGQTGEFIGNIPIDKKKALLYTLGIFATCMIITSIISYILYLGGIS